MATSRPNGEPVVYPMHSVAAVVRQVPQLPVPQASETCLSAQTDISSHDATRNKKGVLDA